MAFAIEIRKRSEAHQHADESYCMNCRSWHSNDSWIRRTDYETGLFSSVTERSLGEVGVPGTETSTVWQPEYQLETVYECPSCYYYVKQLNEEDEDDEPHTHLCGACGEGWWSLEDAQDCCEGATVADPAVFQRAMRED